MYDKIPESNMVMLCLYGQFEEKNIRRRVYDAFNVLMAIDAIVKDKKEIRWVGWSCTKTAELKGLKVSFISINKTEVV